MKKGDLSVNIIVIAAIALLILVIIAALLFGAFGDFREGQSCEGIGGQCVDLFQGETCAERLGEGWTRHPTASCEVSGETCCIGGDR